MKTILCIDDDSAIQEIFQVALGSAGYNVLTAADWETGQRLLDAQSIDLVLLDLGLPGTDGFTVCRELAQRKETPVLFVSGCSRSFTAKSETFMALYQNEFLRGTIDILYKPFSLALLFVKVESLIGVDAQ